MLPVEKLYKLFLCEKPFCHTFKLHYSYLVKLVPEWFYRGTDVFTYEALLKTNQAKQQINFIARAGDLFLPEK